MTTRPRTPTKPNLIIEVADSSFDGGRGAKL